jgi:hypothetical protein|tara:strand:- start:752 stop:1006 length:255 start_codon:yes stop_codon:yes gene_type:complete
MTVMTKQDRLLDALVSGEELSAKQIAARFGAGNPGSVVQMLRFQGHSIYLNKRTNSKGQTKGFYRLGTPTRAIVAAGYRALASA